jgi:cyanate lyase
MPTATTITTISRDQFRHAVRRNIRSLLAMTELDQQDLAPMIGLSKSQLSDRLTCQTAWKDEELLNVAAAFGTSHRAVVALDVDEFRQAINDAPPQIHVLQGSVQQSLFDLAA